MESESHSDPCGGARRGAYYDIKQSLTFNVERDVLYDDSSGYDLVVPSRCSGSDWRGVQVTQWRRASGRGQIGVVGGRERAIVGYTSRTIKPLLNMTARAQQ